ncbi:MAG: ATP-binding protein [Phycisphaerae bacterium]
MIEIVVQSDLASAKRPEELILAEVERCGYCPGAAFAIKLALEEALTNAVRHGNSGDATKHIFVRYRVTRERTEIEIRDEGRGFQPDCVPDPTRPENIDCPNGRGIMLMQAYLDEIEYVEPGNLVRLVKWNR